VSKKIIESTSRFDKLIKPMIQKVKYPKGYQHSIMIMGCQRSGTTLISNIFNKLPYSRVYGEFSELSDDDIDRIRLNSIKSVLRKLDNTHAPLIVMKPLVESQNALQLLDSIPSSSVLWVYRHFIDVAKSDALKFNKTAGHGNLQAIIAGDDSNWRCQNLSEETRDTIKSLYTKTLSGLECSCLFWYARNSLYFQQNLDNHQKVLLWSYEDLLNDVPGYFQNILTYHGFKFPSKDLGKDTFSNVGSKSELTNINPSIEEVCSTLYKKLSCADKSINQA